MNVIILNQDPRIVTYKDPVLEPDVPGPDMNFFKPLFLETEYLDAMDNWMTICNLESYENPIISLEIDLIINKLIRYNYFCHTLDNALLKDDHINWIDREPKA